MRVAKLRVGTLRVEVRAKRASIWVKCETSECASRLLKDRRWQLESISRTCQQTNKGERSQPRQQQWVLKESKFYLVLFQSKSPRNSEIDISQSRLLPAGSLVGSFPFVATQSHKVDRSRMSVRYCRADSHLCHHDVLAHLNCRARAGQSGGNNLTSFGSSINRPRSTTFFAHSHDVSS